MSFTLVLGAAWIALAWLLVLVLLVEVLAGARGWPEAAVGRVEPPGYVVLIPAHDEAGVIAATVHAVREQLPPAGRLLVVADNCSDGTAAIARAAGATVIERHEPALRGKGYALAFGVQHLRSAPPACVVILDADCEPAPCTLDLLAARAARSGRPVQALYLMLARPGSPLRLRMAAFAWALRNEVRPRGLHRLGFPCHLMGSGMGFPWHCLDAADLASGHLVEDLQLGLALAAAGSPPEFCPEARVQSWFPEERSGQDSQRKRWEHGHLSLIFGVVPRTLWHGVRRLDASAVVRALDLCVPPLALLAVLVALACAWGAWLGPWATAAAGGAALAYLAAVLLAWLAVGRRWVSLAELATTPVYVLRKLPLYAGFVLRRQKEWVRTSRDR